MVGSLLVILHLVVSVLIFLGVWSRVLKVHKYMFFVALLLPFWGAAVVLVLHFGIFLKRDGRRDVEVEKLKLESELYRSVTMDESMAASGVVPIEEALVVNSARERRSIIMDVLNDDPKQYISFLQKAGNNDDTEVVHYAVTAMVEISKENDYKLQDFERRHAAQPEDMELLGQYTDFLWSCLSQGLMQGQVEVLNRELFSDLMRKKLEIRGEVADFTRLIRNELERKNYALAAEYIEKMACFYPDREEYYMTKLDYLAALGRGEQIRELMDELEEKNIFLSAAAREVLAFWRT